ncbi:MAG: TonB-dependent receptor [Pseudomonadota bacterium]
MRASGSRKQNACPLTPLLLTGYMLAHSVAASDEPAGDLVLEEVFVYGQKREDALRDTTSSIVVFGPKFNQDLTFTELQDLYRFAPNVKVDDGDEGTFSIRGISYNGVGFAGVSNTASLYVDDIYQSNLGIEAGPLSTFDIAQVEIYRGPQSTLQGRNALAGAIIVRTQDPTYEWDVKGRVEAAEYDTRRYSIAAGGPIVDEELAFRLSYDHRDTDGYIENTTLNRDDTDSDKTINARAKLLWDPAENSRALLTYIYSEGDGGTGLGAGAVEGPDYFDRELSNDNVNLLKVETHNIALKLEQQLTASMRFTWVNTFTDADGEASPRFEVLPNSNTGADIGRNTEKIYTSDLRLSYIDEAWNLLAGLYFFDSEETSDRTLEFPISIGPITTRLNLVELSKSKVDNYAAYFDGEYAFFNRLTLVFGARYDREKYDVNSTSSTIFMPEIPPFAESAIGGELISDTTYDAFLPKAGLRYALTDAQSIGFVVQRGYRPGGSGISLAGQLYEFDPEYLWNYEVSYRSLWFNDRLQLNANVFYMDWKDQQIFIGQDVDRIVVNAGQSRLYGAEVDMQVQATENILVFAALGYNNTKFTDFDAVDPLLTGNEFPFAPPFEASLGAIANFRSGVFMSADVSYTAESHSDAFNGPSAATPDLENKLDDYTLVNAKLGYRWRGWTGALFARNLLDEDYALRISSGDVRSLGTGLASVGAPRVYGAELRFDL